MKTREEEVEDYTNGYEQGFDTGYKHGWHSAKGGLQWKSVLEEQPPEKLLVLYFFECTGVSAGYYEGRCEEYPAENNHVFASPRGGFLTGDVTHWMYMPEDPLPRVDLSDNGVEYPNDEDTSTEPPFKLPDYDDGTMGMKAD